jgi:hypothetical protein
MSFLSLVLSTGVLLAQGLTSDLQTWRVFDFANTGTARTAVQPFECPVTPPNGETYTGEPAGGNHGNTALVTWLWPNGKIVFRPGGAGFVLSDGALSMKFGWWRRITGSLRVEGRRLDADAPPMRASIPCCYEESGFQATALIFPTPGCWEVTGRVADGSLTFVTLVEKIGAGPSSPTAR